MNQFGKNIDFPVAYLRTILLSNVRSFKGDYEIPMFDKNENPSQWTVILGNNNTGKTTMLKCVADLYLRTEKMSKEWASKYNPQLIGEDFFFINANEKPLDLINNQQGNYFVELNMNPKFGSELIDVIKKEKRSSEKWGISINNEKVTSKTGHPHIRQIFLQGYSTQRKTSESSLSEQENTETVQSFFTNNFELINVEEWLLQINYASKNDDSPSSDRERAKSIEKRVREVITSEILPDIQDFRFRSTQDFKNYIEFQTDYGWIRLKDLGYGYQATLAWVMDLAKRMFDRYPTSKNPLAEPAVVLVDEIDLHLHPEWQRKIISYLSNIFKNTQFIVTAHSPLVVQSAENVNLVMLEKDGNHINIRQQFGSFKGWTVDEILDELMGMNDKTMSDTYLELMKNFDDALDEDNYEKAQVAYDGLDKILHPSSSQRKILRIQMSSLAPIEA